MLNVQHARTQFPALSKQMHRQPVAYFDGPAGTQVPQAVADAVSRCLIETNANRSAPFATSQELEKQLAEATQAVADFVGSTDRQTIVFGPNMTTLTFGLSRALARTWKPGDEVITTSLEHDANFTPWRLAAEDAGIEFKVARVNQADCTLDVGHLFELISPRTKLVAVTMASNLSGSTTPVCEIIEKAHECGALVFLDAVHLATHRQPHVEEIGADFLAFSAYKVFGPHVGVLYGRRKLLDSIEPYKLRPASTLPPYKWMTGTQNHEGICGVGAAIDYLASLCGESLQGKPRPARLRSAFEQIEEHEHRLLIQLLDGLESLPGVQVHGITDRTEFVQRVPTVSITHPDFTPQQLAARLANEGIFVWPGNHYALPLTESTQLEPHGTLRIGIVHYNTDEEVTRLTTVLDEILGSS